MARVRRGTAFALLMLLLAPMATHAERRAETVTLQLDNGQQITAELRLPASGSDAPYPAVMLFGGLRAAGEVLDLLPEHSRPLALASFDYPFEAPRSFDFPGSIRHLPAARRAIFDTLEGIAKLFEALKRHPEIDAERITVVGASLGAPFAVIAGAEQGIPGIVAVQGYGRLASVISHQFRLRWEREWGRPGVIAAGLMGHGISLWARLPEPETHARTLAGRQAALLISAEDDRIIPEDATEALWQAMQESSARVDHQVLPGGHLRSDADALIREIFRVTVDWKQQKDLL